MQQLEALLTRPRTARKARVPAGRRPPLPVELLALVAAVGTLLPVAYLLVRVWGLGADSWELLWWPRTIEVALRSLVLAGAVTLTATLLGTLAAWLVSRTDLPGRQVWTVLLALPLVVPSYVAAFAWIAALSPGGLLPSMFAPLVPKQAWPEIYGPGGAGILISLLTYPYVFLTVRAAFRRLDPALEDASRSMGHGEWSTFLQITLPQLRSALGAGALLVALYTLSDFGAVSLFRFESFTWAIYNQYRGSFDRSLAALLSLVLVAFTLLILAGESALRGATPAGRRTRGASAARTVPLGRWKIPALFLCTAVTALAVGLPVSVTGYWLLRGLAVGERLGALWTGAANALIVSAAAALLAGLFGLAVGLAATRFRSLTGRLTERVTYIGYGLPGIVLGLSLVFFGANWVPSLYQTLVMLVFAYCIRFLPQAVGSVSSSLRQISPRLEEAGLGLGHTRLQVLWTVTLPLARPGLMAGMALVFLTTMKELPITLLLGPTGFETLATQIWSATSEAFFARAAAPALLLLALSAASLWLLLRQDPERSL